MKDLAVLCEKHTMFLSTGNIDDLLLGAARKTGEGDWAGQGVSLPSSVAGQVVEIPTSSPRHAHWRFFIFTAFASLLLVFTPIIYVEWVRLCLQCKEISGTKYIFGGPYR